MTTQPPLGHPLPGATVRVLVLLATFNGMPHLVEQLDSIAGQLDVEVSVLASDDGSTDGSVELLGSRLEVTLLPPVDVTSRSAAGNFYRLVCAVDDQLLARFDYVALADQDDEWNLGKLRLQIAELRARGAEGVSSNVEAFDDDGRRWLVKKDYPQRALDFLLESAGPGCSFLLTPRAVRLIRSVLVDPDSAANQMPAHDWLFYGVVRSAGWCWHICPEYTIEYRQHDTNAFGANKGFASKVARLGMIREHWHRNGARLMAQVGVSVAERTGADSSVLVKAHRLLSSRRIVDRWRLALLAGQLRRRPAHRLAIFGLVLSGVW
jgi:rhamnosyltransferase